MSDYEEIWYSSDDGLKLYARDYPCEGAPLTLLCMHGLTRNSADFEDLAPALNDRWRVVSVDQRGRGESAWDNNSDNYTPARYVQDMLTLMDHLDLQNIVLVGTSMGGIMAMMMAAMKPDVFRAVVLNDIGPVVAARGIDRIKGYVGRSEPVNSVAAAVEQTRTAAESAFPHYRQSDWERWVKRMYRENDAGQLALRYDPAIATPMNSNQDSAVPPDLWPLFDAMKTLPLMVIRGELSDILEPACVEEMQRRHPGMAFHEVRGVGHAPMLDEPGVVESVREFLKGV